MRRYRILLITHESLVPPDARDAGRDGGDESLTEYHVYSTLRASDITCA